MSFVVSVSEIVVVVVPVGRCSLGLRIIDNVSIVKDWKNASLVEGIK